MHIKELTVVIKGVEKNILLVNNYYTDGYGTSRQYEANSTSNDKLNYTQIHSREKERGGEKQVKHRSQAIDESRRGARKGPMSHGLGKQWLKSLHYLVLIYHPV